MIEKYLSYINKCREECYYVQKHFNGINGYDYTLVMDVFKKLEKHNYKIGIYGTGEHAELILKIFLFHGFKDNIKCFIDESKPEGVFYSFPLKNDVSVVCDELDVDGILIASKLYERDIYNRILPKVRNGVELIKIYDTEHTAEERVYFIEDEEIDISKRIYLWRTYQAHLNRYAFAQLFTANKVVLDIACGSGYGAQLMAENAKLVYGVDLSEDAISFATKHHAQDNVHYINASIEDLNLGENKADVIVSFETIEHIEDTDIYFATILKNIKDDGICIISTPIAEKDGKNENNIYHVNEYTIGRFQKELNKYFVNIKWYSQRYAQDGGIFIDDGNFSNIEKNGCFAIAVCSSLKNRV